MKTVDMRKIANGLSCWDEQGVYSVGINPGYGCGSLSAVTPLQRNILLVTQDFSLRGDTEILMDREEPAPSFFGFTVCLSGVTHLAYDHPRISLGQGFADIVMTEHRECTAITVEGNVPVRTVDVCIPLSGVSELTGRNVQELITALDRLDSQAGSRTCPNRRKELDMAQTACAYQIFSACSRQPQDLLFLEAKALELMALQLHQLDCLLGGTCQPKPCGTQTENIVYAGEILKKEMTNPPTILDLAQRAGLNHNQLIDGFRQIFGQTPFEYLRILRLERARELIVSRERNVTEAAYEVGYSSLSHFTNNFRKEFGFTPKALQKAGEKQFFTGKNADG